MVKFHTELNMLLFLFCLTGTLTSVVRMISHQVFLVICVSFFRKFNFFPFVLNEENHVEFCYCFYFLCLEASDEEEPNSASNISN